ncbi:uncharacterized protein AMSG_03275 [Thecamonas trahens ATCC 50062]|uniref:Tim10-like domain-containing protein n=1 Tax=Thecamonas trahens ATCC 50062 TaxID=461836 RepID=A0A0L0D3N4_THETB|nr:hypothetical protein AMSG_03275 [Thecamonas trahens ATCC 50062]KNC46845.1 hypothetical protein AMSG_03275 [Thecamonas trahens ATCC 50062]|eukprot:XP_013760118.1 hypothetical protein AMSG_03275 [Thecamonas trahens ATCC 50062]
MASSGSFGGRAPPQYTTASPPSSGYSGGGGVPANPGGGRGRASPQAGGGWGAPARPAGPPAGHNNVQLHFDAQARRHMMRSRGGLAEQCFDDCVTHFKWSYQGWQTGEWALDEAEQVCISNCVDKFLAASQLASNLFAKRIEAREAAQAAAAGTHASGAFARR